ncbi:protein of unknown function [Methylorubrum extorquens DM4]|uniref:Uncharacterized protein n=1 Tax=Methylorubrum extorquens (strain DSM 6343 / CIP 106787 / DM4) TaxID=661410 RepID=C7CBC3_METED|nr:protein of unknown function [Methylorubrum extorquens DM4]
MRVPCQLQHSFDSLCNLDQQSIPVPLVLSLGFSHRWLPKILAWALSPPQRGAGQKRSTRCESGEIFSRRVYQPSRENEA